MGSSVWKVVVVPSSASFRDSRRPLAIPTNGRGTVMAKS